MVIQDIFIDQTKKNRINNAINLAAPRDRILAILFDLLFHAPIFTLISSMILYRLNLLKLTAAAPSEKIAIMAQLIWINTVGYIILNSIYLKLWSKTPGMKLFKLELVSLTDVDLSWGQCVIRSVIFCFELLFFGVPLLEIFAHPSRLTLHDRASETKINTLKKWGAIPPLEAEKSTVRLIYTCFLMISLGWITALFSGLQKNIQTGSMALTEWREQKRLCSQVDEVAIYSDVDLSQVIKRIDFSTSLFLLEQISKDCFQKEIDFAIFKKLNDPLVWVGRTLLSVPYSKERNSYFLKACSQDSSWCQKTLFNEKGTLLDAKKILTTTESKEGENQSLTYKTAKLILLNRLGSTQKAETLIQDLQKNGLRATGLVLEDLKVLSKSNPEKIESVLSTLKSVMVEKDFLQINANICLRKLEEGCGRKINECNTMATLLPKYKDSLNDLSMGRAVLKSALCKNDLSSGMEYWTLINDDGLQELIQYAHQLQNQNTEALGLSKLRVFIKDESQKIELRLDALQLLIGQSKYSDDWKLVSFLWNRFDWTHPSFLSVSEWLIRESVTSDHRPVIAKLGDTFSSIPGLKFQLKFQKLKVNGRFPASDVGSTK